MIERPDYINELIKFKDKELIKIITGIRRCGKSTLMELFKNYLIKEGVTQEQIISINLEDLRYHFIQNYMDLYNYINEKLLNDKNIKTKKIIQILLLGLLAYPLYAQQTEIKVSSKVTDVNNETLEGVTSLPCLKSREDSLLFSVNI